MAQLQLLTVRLFGGLSIVGPDGRPHAVQGNRRQALFAYLVCHAGRRLLREELAQMFWPDLEPIAALRALRNVLYHLKLDLTRICGTATLLQQDNASLLVLPDCVSVDFLDFADILNQLQQHDHEPTAVCSGCLAGLNRLLEWYAGELLPGSFSEVGPAFHDWLSARRHSAERAAINAAALLSERCLALGEYLQAVTTCLRWLELERWNEQAYRVLMEALARSGDRNGALAAFRRCRNAVRREFGTEPELATFSLYNRIRSGRLDASVVPPAVGGVLPRHALQQRIIRQIEQPACRLLTLVGLSGSGKSTIAELVAGRLSLQSDLRTTFVQLNGSQHEGRAAAALAMALGLDLSRETDPLNLLRKELCGGRRLLVLDQFDQLADIVPLLQRLMRWADGPKLIVTARAPFGLVDEWRQPIDGLQLAPDGWDGSEPWPESVGLFVETIRRQEQDFKPSREQLLRFAADARSVEGLPLALVLLAEQFVQRPDAHRAAYRRPRGTITPSPSAQQRIAAAIAASWQLLQPDERRLLTNLAIVQSSFTIETAHALAPLADAVDVPLESRLYDLVDRGLLRITHGRRFSWHALVQDVARHAFDLLPDAAEIRRQYADLFGRRAIELAQRLERLESVGSDSWQAELADYIVALRTSCSFQPPEQIGRRLSALVRLLILAGRSDLGISLTAELRGLLEPTVSSGQSAALALLGLLWLEEARLCYYAADISHGLHCSNAGRRIADQCGDADVMLRSLIETARLHLITHDLQGAAGYIRRIQELRRRPALDPLVLSFADRVLVQFLAETGDFSEARAAAERLLGPQSRGDREMRASAILLTIQMRWSVGDIIGAFFYLDSFLESVATRATLGEDWSGAVVKRILQRADHVFDRDEVTAMRYPSISKSTSIVTYFVAQLLNRLGLFDAAEAAYHDALLVSYAGGGPWSRRGILTSRARNALRRGNASLARQFAGEAHTLSLAIGDRRFLAVAETILATTYRDEQPALAEAYHRTALERFEQIGVAYWCAEPLAGLAELALARGDLASARAAVERILALDWPYFWQIDDPVAVMGTVATVVRAVDDGGWQTIAAETAGRIEQIARTLPDGQCRQAFHAIPSHRAITALLESAHDVVLSRP